MILSKYKVYFVWSARLLGGDNNFQYAPNPLGWVDPLGLEYRRGTTRQIKRELNIPMTQHPSSQRMVPMTDKNGNYIGATVGNTRENSITYVYNTLGFGGSDDTESFDFYFWLSDSDSCVNTSWTLPFQYKLFAYILS